MESNPSPSNPQQEKLNEIVERLKTTANIVGGDFGMKVQLGQAGKGSYFNTQEVSITFDPRHILEDPELVELVAVHEGAHRAVSRGPEVIGLKKEEIPQIFDQIGFDFLYQSIEDNAANSWASNRFDYGKELIQKHYRKNIEAADQSEGAFFGTDSPEVRSMVRMLGHTPKFMHYGTEVRRWWIEGKLKDKLDPDLRSCLEKTIQAFENAYKRLPGAHPKEKEVRQKAKERFTNMYSNVWPEYKKLVDQDISEEKLAEMVKEELEKMQQELENQQSPLNDLPPDLRDELEQKIQQATKEFEKQQEQEQKEKEENAEEEGDENTEGEDQETKEEGRPGKTSQREDGESEGKEEGESESTGKEQKEPKVVPLDKLSKELIRALQKIFDKLPQEQKDKLIQQAKKKLAELEDAISKELQSKLSEENAPTHTEIVAIQAEQKAKEEKQENEQMEKEIEEMERNERAEELGKKIESQLTEYDRYYKEVREIVDDLYDKVERIFQPNRQPRWQKGHPSGGRLDLQAAREFERDPSKYTGLWERKTIPQKRDYRFITLVDLSGSMEQPAKNIDPNDPRFQSWDPGFDLEAYQKLPTKLQETFKGVIVLTEVLNKLRIENEVIGFTTGFPGNYKIYKKFEDILNNDMRTKITSMLHERHSYTPTHDATRAASGLLEKKGVKNQFLVTLTDGTPDDPLQTKEVIANIRKNTSQKLMGIGLGAGTEFVGEYYPASLVLPDVSQLSDKLAKLFEEMIRNPEKYK